MNKNKKINIAIVGLGNIGSYLYRYLQKNTNFVKKNNCILNISYISAKNRLKKKVLKLIKKNGFKII